MRISDWSSDVCSSDLGLFHACLHTEHARKSVRRMAVQNDHNARSCLSNDLHGTRQELTARAFLTQQVSEGRELMHAHQSWRVEADAPFLEGYLFRAGRLVEEGHGSPVATPAAGELHFRPFLDQMIIAPPIGYKITDRT